MGICIFQRLSAFEAVRTLAHFMELELWNQSSFFGHFPVAH